MSATKTQSNTPCGTGLNAMSKMARLTLLNEHNKRRAEEYANLPKLVISRSLFNSLLNLLSYKSTVVHMKCTSGGENNSLGWMASMKLDM